MSRFLPLVLVLLTACVSYKFEHVNLDGSRDSTRFTAFIYAGQASKIRSALLSSNYNRTVTVGAVEGKPDSDFLRATVEASVEAGARIGAKLGKSALGVP